MAIFSTAVLIPQTLRLSLLAVSLATFLFAAPAAIAQEEEEPKQTLLEAKAHFSTSLTKQVQDEEPLEQPNPEYFQLVQVPTELGDMGAYLGVNPKEGEKHPAIIWLVGGFPVGGAWPGISEAGPHGNDQTASAYREAGIVMMYPTLRGSYGNPGYQESFLGEVNDVLAALEFLRSVDYVDPEQIYLGGHSTGGTLALLVAQSTDRFRAVFSFGPVSRPKSYGEESLTYDPENKAEDRVRAPIHYLEDISCPTLVLEAADGNMWDVLGMKSTSKNPLVEAWVLPQGDHWSILSPCNRLLAAQIQSAPKEQAFSFPLEEIQAANEAMGVYAREADDLYTLGRLRSEGLDLSKTYQVEHVIYSWDREDLEYVLEDAELGFEDFPSLKIFEIGEIRTEMDNEEEEVYLLTLTISLKLGDLDTVFAASKAIQEAQVEWVLEYDGWGVPNSAR